MAQQLLLALESEVTSRLSALPTYTHKSRRHRPASGVIRGDAGWRAGDPKGCWQELPVAFPHPKDPSMWWRRKSTGLSPAQRLSMFSQDAVAKNGLFPED